MIEPQKHVLTAKQRRLLSDYQQRQQAATKIVKPSISTIETVESFYKVLDSQNETSDTARLMLTLRHWLTDVLSFDPVSGQALPAGIVEFMSVVGKTLQGEVFEGEIKDRIYRIVAHTKDAVLAIMAHTRDKILREHAMLPIHAAREVDSKSVQWLSRQPGRTLREKLSGKPYIKAVLRRTSLDTAENQLLKAFLCRLEQVLIERQNAVAPKIDDTCEEMLVIIQRWLRSEEVTEISSWENHPPNNTLLQDKRYRKVWDGWLWLQRIDEHIMADHQHVQRDVLNVIYWKTLSFLHCSGRFRTVQQPVNFNYDNFAICPEIPVEGYFFPVIDSKIKGKIKNINHEKGFGFITFDGTNNLFFHQTNLVNKLDINALKIGDEVSFVIGANPKGECAKNITLTTIIPPVIYVSFTLSDEILNIHLAEKKFSLQIDSGYLIIQQAQGIKQRIKIELANLNDLASRVLSLLTNLSSTHCELENDESDLTPMDSCIIDLCAIRPKLTNHLGAQIDLPFRLMQQTWALSNGSRYVLDCGHAKAIYFGADVETVSMKKLFAHRSVLSESAKSSASMFFTRKLHEYIRTNRLTYLIPDWGNDFDLEGIRKSVNFYFEESAPLPQSIAAIFAWQSSSEFLQELVRENDLVLVVDAFDEGLSITPVHAQYQETLETILPETQGISWERHPTFILENRNIHSTFACNLAKDGCLASEETIQLFDFDGTVSDAGKVSFMKDGHCYHLPDSIRDALSRSLDSILSNSDIDAFMNLMESSRRKGNIFILPLADVIKKPELRNDYKWLGSVCSPIKGGQALKVWQEKAADIALWCDHLPDLSFKDIPQQFTEQFYWWADFELVKNATVIPKRGKTTNISVLKTFKLPAGQAHYEFKLQQGKGNKELQFVAYLKSPAFPLKDAVTCKLKMTYTYGADDPYELKFIPLDFEKSGFKSIRVEWRSASENESIKLENLLSPDFPVRKSWAEFQKYPNAAGGSFSDLLDWCSSKVAGLDRLFSFDDKHELQTAVTRRKIGHLEWGARDRGGKYYCRVNVGGENVFCHSSQFVEKIDESALNKGSLLYLDVSTNEKGMYGENISFSEIFPSILQEKLQSSVSGRYSKILETVEKGIFSLRFPVLTIWNHDHSLSELDAPEHFRKIIFDGTQKAELIINSTSIPKSLENELFFFLCCLHRDAPEIVSVRLLKAVENSSEFKKNNKNIAFAIGNAELPWQQKLLRNIISPINKEPALRSITLEDLAIVLWRSEELIFKLEEADISKLCHDLFEQIEADMRLLKDVIPKQKLQYHLEKGLSESEANKRERNKQANTFCKHLELLLALIRSRGSQDKSIKILLAPTNELAKRYVALVDEAAKVVIDSNIELKSRINIQIDKPEIFRKTPDLLYALRVYLTGDSGAGLISILGISDDE